MEQPLREVRTVVASAMLASNLFQWYKMQVPPTSHIAATTTYIHPAHGDCPGYSPYLLSLSL